RDALGRVRQLDDPNRGTTTSTHDGFGELVSSTDALGRMVTFTYDALGRTKSRVDQDGGQSLTTTWTWDTAPNGIGKLQELAGPEGTKTYTYNMVGQFPPLTRAVAGKSETLTGRLDYDMFGRVGTITYPTPAASKPFAVVQDHDAYGHVVTVRDAATSSPTYWRLTEVD